MTWTAEGIAHELESCGYAAVDEFLEFRPGARAWQTSRPYRPGGTGVVVAIYRRDPSPWAQTYGRPDVELVYREDGGRVAQLADYHLRPVASS